MFKKIFEYFGYTVVKSADYHDSSSLLLDKAGLMAEVNQLKKKLQQAEVSLQAYANGKPVIDIIVGDPSPKDKKERALYVAAVAGLHRDILEPKLKQMIANTLRLLEEATNDREYDQALKGACYALRELIRWGDLMVNEQLALQAEGKESAEEKN